MIIGNHACVLCGYPYIFACSEEGGGYRPCEVCTLRAERDQLRDQADHFEDRLDRERLDHEETKGYRAHAEQERDQLREAMRGAGEINGQLRDEVERLKKAIRFFRSWAHGIGEVADSMWKSANDALGDQCQAQAQAQHAQPERPEE